MRHRAGNRETGSTTFTTCARESRVYSNFGGLSKGGFLGVFRCVQGVSRRLHKVFRMFLCFYRSVHKVSMFLQKYKGAMQFSPSWEQDGRLLLPELLAARVSSQYTGQETVASSQ